MHRFDPISHKDQCLRNAIWKVYGKKCFYCGIMLDLNSLEIDHIIPTNRDDLVDNVEKLDLEEYIKSIEAKGFIINCLQNYLPSCGHCNKMKSNDFFTVGNLRYFHEHTSKKVSKVIEELEKLKYKKVSIVEARENESLIKERQNDESLVIDKQILEGLNTSYYVYGLGEVRLNAFLPVDFESKLSCLIMFKQKGISECMFSLDEDYIQSLFFDGYSTGINIDRKFIWYIKDDSIGLKLPYNRFTTDMKTVKQLCELTDDLYREFHKRKEQLVNVVGGRLFEEVGSGMFKLITLPKWIWYKMYDFAQKHDYAFGDSKWDIFYPTNYYSRDKIIIYKNHKAEFDADVLVELVVKDSQYDYVEILWKAGYSPQIDNLDGFNNVQKWTVEYTHDWIINEFLPYVFYKEEENKEHLLKNMFKKKIDFEVYKSQFDGRKYNIISGKIE